MIVTGIIMFNKDRFYLNQTGQTDLEKNIMVFRNPKFLLIKNTSITDTTAVKIIIRVKDCRTVTLVKNFQTASARKIKMSADCKAQFSING